MLTVLLLLSLPLPAGVAARPPPAPQKPVTDVIQGVPVRDDYRWLEDGSSTESAAWTGAQDAFARKALAALPGLPALRQRIGGIYRRRSPAYLPLGLHGGRLFALKQDPNLQQPLLVALASPDDLASERVLLDPNRLDPSGHTAIDWAVPSPDGMLLAVSLSVGGSESGDLHLYQVASGAESEPILPRVQGGTAGGSLAWASDGRGFWYTRYPRAGEREAGELPFWQQVWFHALGRPHAEDRAELTELGRIAEVELERDRDGEAVLADVRNGDGGEHAFWLKQGAAPWQQVTRFQDQAVAAAVGGGALWLLSRKGAPRGEILRLPLERPSLDQAVRVVEQGVGSLQALKVTPARLYASEIRGGPTRLRVFDHSGKELPPVPSPEVATVDVPLRLSGESVIFRAVTYLDPATWYHYDGLTGRTEPTALRQKPVVDYSPYEAVREECLSRDGTRVPLAILRRKGIALDGHNPVRLLGYGGYGVSMTPSYRATRIAFLEQGGVIAIASLRGGGEYGEEWHLAGNLTRKQTVFDDFLACAEHLIAGGYTRPDRLAIEGGSNGGLLMGAALTQRPHLFRAVVSHVGIYDMLRVELSPNGAFNVTEFGTVKDPAQFAALLGYSPYHHVVDGVAYPSVLLLTGQNDPRVEPMQSRKMAARLQAASSSGRPVLLRVEKDSGHGIGASRDEQIETQAVADAFLLHELGVTVKRVVEAPPKR